MVSRDFQALTARRVHRARKLAERYPASREALEFFADVATVQGRIPAALPLDKTDLERVFDSLVPYRQPLVELVEATGPQQLRDEARHYDEASCRESLGRYFRRNDIRSPRSFFARVLLQPAIFAGDFAAVHAPPLSSAISREDSVMHRNSCPRCQHPPQAGCLRPLGDGTALSLVCSLCLEEWPFGRLRCPACGESDHRKCSFYATAEFPHLETQVCESCHNYLHLVHLEKEVQAVPDVDELAALPLDVWAQEKGYRKTQPNLAGI